MLFRPFFWQMSSQNAPYIWGFGESFCGFMAVFLCVSMRGDNVFSSDWQMRWSLAPRSAPLLAFPLFHHRLPPFLQPPLPACSYLSAMKDFDRKGNLTLGMGQRWRREQEPSGACVHAALQKGLQLVGQSARFLTCWQGLWLPIYLYRISRKKGLSPHGGGHQKWHCPHCNTTTADNKELRTRRIERVTEELITSQQHAGCLNKYGGREKGRRRRRRCKGRESKPQLMGE